MLKINGEFTYSGDAVNSYIVISDTDGAYVQRIINMSSLHLSNDAEIAITEDGILYISTALDNFSFEKMFSILREEEKESPIDRLNSLEENLKETAIKQTASGENIHVDDSVNSKVREFALFGKAKQNTTSGNQLANLPNMDTTTYPGNGIKYSCKNGAITLNMVVTIPIHNPLIK